MYGIPFQYFSAEIASVSLETITRRRGSQNLEPSLCGGCTCCQVACTISSVAKWWEVFLPCLLWLS